MDILPPTWGEHDEPDVEDAFGEHDIEYWVWRGHTLIPATPEQAVALREHEALARLARWQQAQMQARSAGERHGLAAVTWAVRTAVTHPLLALAGMPLRLAHRPKEGGVLTNATEGLEASDALSRGLSRDNVPTAEQRVDEAGMGQT
jgi:hypothetical protein